MDDLVEKALARWPNVPAIAGWLKLGAQGDWLLTGPVPQGLSITNERILNFIARNYAIDPDGRCYFQNGPQKVYVALEATPWIYRVYSLGDGSLMLATHTGLLAWPSGMVLDEQGRLYIQTTLGIGLVHGSDTPCLAEGLQPHGEGYTHRARWCVPEGDPDALVRVRVRLRKPDTLSPRCTALDLPVLEQSFLALKTASGFECDPHL